MRSTLGLRFFKLLKKKSKVSFSTCQPSGTLSVPGGPDFFGVFDAAVVGGASAVCDLLRVNIMKRGEAAGLKIEYVVFADRSRDIVNR